MQLCIYIVFAAPFLRANTEHYQCNYNNHIHDKFHCSISPCVYISAEEFLMAFRGGCDDETSLSIYKRALDVLVHVVRKHYSVT